MAKRWQRRKDARPPEILDAALAVFAQKGFAATKLDDIAAKAGITKGTIYLYFDSKQALFEALARQSVGAQIEQVTAELANFPELAEFWRREIIERGIGLMSGIIQRGIERGEFRRIEPQHAARLCVAPLLIIVLWRATFAQFDEAPYDYQG